VGENLYEPSLSFTASSVDAIVTYETEDWAGNISIE
jgi:hypothetical protein